MFAVRIPIINDIHVEKFKNKFLDFFHSIKLQIKHLGKLFLNTLLQFLPLPQHNVINKL